MATFKINCPKCVGTGITGELPSTEVVCTQCKGVGVITCSDTDTMATTNSTSQAPFFVTKPTAIPGMALRRSSLGK